MHVRSFTEEINMLKLCVPYIRLCSFTSLAMASQQLNTLTTAVILSLLGAADVTHPFWVREVPASISYVYVWIVVYVSNYK